MPMRKVMAGQHVARVAHPRAEAHVAVVDLKVVVIHLKEVVAEVLLMIAVAEEEAVAQRRADVAESLVARRIQAIGASSSRTMTTSS